MAWRPTNPASKLIARALITAHRAKVIELPAIVAALCVETLVTRTITPGERIRLGLHWQQWGPKLAAERDAGYLGEVPNEDELGLAIAV